MKNERVMVRLVKKQAGSNYKEVTLETGGNGDQIRSFVLLTTKTTLVWIISW